MSKLPAAITITEKESSQFTERVTRLITLSMEIEQEFQNLRQKAVLTEDLSGPIQNLQKAMAGATGQLNMNVAMKMLPPSTVLTMMEGKKPRRDEPRRSEYNRDEDRGRPRERGQINHRRVQLEHGKDKYPKAKHSENAAVEMRQKEDRDLNKQGRSRSVSTDGPRLAVAPNFEDSDRIRPDVASWIVPQIQGKPGFAEVTGPVSAMPYLIGLAPVTEKGYRAETAYWCVNKFVAGGKRITISKIRFVVTVDNGAPKHSIVLEYKPHDLNKNHKKLYVYSFTNIPDTMSYASDPMRYGPGHVRTLFVVTETEPKKLLHHFYGFSKTNGYSTNFSATSAKLLVGFAHEIAEKFALENPIFSQSMGHGKDGLNMGANINPILKALTKAPDNWENVQAIDEKPKPVVKNYIPVDEFHESMLPKFLRDPPSGSNSPPKKK